MAAKLSTLNQELLSKEVVTPDTSLIKASFQEEGETRELVTSTHLIDRRQRSVNNDELRNIYIDPG